jgi:23S rRNA (pseudouridine1915-N3)-methyltransferase
LKLLLVAVGERMPDWVDLAFGDYARRFPRRARLELVEIRPEKRGATRSADQVRAAEAARIAAALPAGCLRVVLDERGRDATTADLARLVERWLGDGRDVAFIAGGPDGLAPEIKAGGDLMLRLSSLTLPHALVRVLLAESLYRALSVIDNHPYHRE